MELLLPGRIEGVATAYGYVRTVFDQVASGERGPTVSITPSIRHVGVTRRDTFRPGFSDAVRASREEGYPVLVRGAGGGATAAHYGTFGFSIIRPSGGAEAHRGITDRYDEAAALALGAFSRLGVRGVAVGEVRDEFCPGDHSIRVGDWESGMKVVGIAQRVTRRATSVGGIVLVEGEGSWRGSSSGSTAPCASRSGGRASAACAPPAARPGSMRSSALSRRKWRSDTAPPGSPSMSGRSSWPVATAART
jgi:octanoyl-[GcvH]:protein N-octanoyltransferase